MINSCVAAPKISALSKAIKKSTLKVTPTSPPTISTSRKTAFELCTETLSEIERLSKESKRESDAKHRVIKGQIAFVKTLLHEMEPLLQAKTDVLTNENENALA